MAEDRDEEEVIPQGKYIKKRALKNKALAVPFNDKDLKDYVTGFHKRKKKRRKEAMQHLEEKARLKRIDNRKKRKLDREFVQFGGAQPASGSEPDENSEGPELEEETEPIGPPPVDGMQTYDNGEMTITVKTSEISREDDESLKEKKEFVPKSSETEKKRSIPVKKKPLKATGGKGGKRRSTPKPQKKRDKRMGKLKMDGMQTYDNGEMTITVKTSEISREDDESLKEKKEFVPKSSETEKKRSIPVKKKPLKATGGKGGKRRSTPKPQKKRDKRMGKLKSKKR